MSPATALLAGRTALVLGIDDIGAGIVRRCHREGARVASLDVEDPTVAEAVSASIRQLGGLDVLVCNLLPAAHPLLLERIQDPALDRALATVRMTIAAMRAALPALRESGRGRIVLIGTRYGENVGEALAAYNAAAWALVGLARTVAVEWGQFQITTNILVPLARTAEFDAARTRRPAVIDRLVEQLPLRRVGDPEEDVGGAVAFLASDAACFVNGEVVCADGGQQVAGPVLNPARFA